ncbi:hypothetical protein V496_00497 [Pseudogymnoascus sp. VKM F-4515 (FW-2607)]|nr:hypothetical protein V496_00497 [Pseudogymnoascus sp. VKM F-4515 (FW-2607)]
MGGKIQLPTGASSKGPQLSYRDDPDRAETASMASAVTLDEYPDDEDLPSYQDIPDIVPRTQHEISYHVIPPVPEGTTFDDLKTISTTHSPFSTSVETLLTFITQQAAYPPTYTLHVKGTHTETFRARGDKGNKKETVVDFDIKLSMTHLLICPNPVHQTNTSHCTDERGTQCRYLLTPQAGEKAHRGTVFANTKDINWQPENGESMIHAWCQAYIDDRSSLKSLEITRSVLLHDTPVVEGLVRRIVDGTSYRGHTKVYAVATESKIIIYSPHPINTLRQNKYLRWFTYLTFLWIFTWPALFFMTKRYTGITAAFPYRREKAENITAKNLNTITAKPLVMAETAFIASWHDSLRRAVLGQHQGWVDEVYRAETSQMGTTGDDTARVQSTASAFLSGVMGAAVSLATGRQARTGWGADS